MNWRFEELYYARKLIAEGPNPESEVLELKDVKIWYDSDDDFHKLSFVAKGKNVEIHLYKVFSCSVDGKRLGITF